MAEQRNADLYSSSGNRVGEVDLDADWFGLEPNVAVMHQVVTAQLAAARAGTHSTKTRAEVRGGGRKPWRQKGLGRARHGSSRSPLWMGGGVTHGPTPRSYVQRTPKKMRRLALRSALSARAADGQVKVVEDFDWEAPKTKQAVALLDAVGIDGKVLVVASPTDTVAARSFRNLSRATIIRSGQLNTYDVLWADTVLFTVEALDSVAGSGSYEVSDSDFVREEQEAGGDEAAAAETEEAAS